MYRYDFRLAGKVIRLEHCQPVTVNPSFQVFQIYEETPDCTVNFFEEDNLNFLLNKPVFSNISFEVQPAKNGFLRQYRSSKEDDRLYAISEIAQDGKSEIVQYLPEFAYAFSESQNSFSHIAIEELLMHQQRMILHASFVNTEFGGILFSGPSGIGKSTQAKLWAEFEHGEIINGDRPILGKEEGIWRAWGSPYAGSSGYHVAKDFPVTAIVILTQGKENFLQRLNAQSAFRGIFSELTINGWNSWYVNRAVDFVLDLVEMVPVYRLECTPDVRAINLLKERLVKEVIRWT